MILSISFCFIIDVYNQYDGIMVPEPTDEKYYRYFTHTLKTEKYEEDLSSAILFALKYFFPKWNGFMLGKDLPTISCKEALNCIEMVHRGFWLSYGNKLRLWRQDYRKFSEYVGKVIFYIKHQVKQTSLL